MAIVRKKGGGVIYIYIRGGVIYIYIYIYMFMRIAVVYSSHAQKKKHSEHTELADGFHLV